MRLALAGTVSLLAMLVFGLGGAGAAAPNGEADKTATQILADVEQAVGTAKTLHVSGSGSSDGSTLTLNLYLVAGLGGQGHITTSGLGFKMVRVGNQAYFEGDKKFLVHFAGPTAAQLFLNRWFFASATKGDLASFTPLTNLPVLMKAVLSSHGTLSKGPTATVGGIPAIELIDQSNGGVLYVSTVGKPYPLELTGGKSKGNILRFQDWDKGVTLVKPKNSINYAKLVAKK